MRPRSTQTTCTTTAAVKVVENVEANRGFTKCLTVKERHTKVAVTCLQTSIKENTRKIAVNSSGASKPSKQRKEEAKHIIQANQEIFTQSMNNKDGRTADAPDE